MAHLNAFRPLFRGNVLLARRDQDEVRYNLHGRSLRARSNGISVALIDFTLSRLDVDGRVLFCDLNADTWLFEGPKGDVQVRYHEHLKPLCVGHSPPFNVWKISCMPWTDREIHTVVREGRG